MNGYQQGIIMALGSQAGERFIVRNKERWYCDSVATVFHTNVYASHYNVPRDGFPQWCVKGHIEPPTLHDVRDWRGFCRAWIEIHGNLDFATRKNRNGTRSKSPRLRIYGQADVLKQVLLALPVQPKKIQQITNNINGEYTGSTFALYFQSSAEIMDIMDFIDGDPRHEATWEKWAEVISSIYRKALTD